MQTAASHASASAGYSLLPGVFAEDDLVELRDAADVALRHMLRAARTADAEQTTVVWADGHRLQTLDGTVIHWEPDALDAVRSLSPVTQLDPRLHALWSDPRLTKPMCELLGVDEVDRFSSGLNLKKAGVGSEYRWHQDAVPATREIANAMIFLDDATPDNGPLCLLPASHAAGRFPIDPADPIGQLADPSRIDVSGAVTIVVGAGSVLMFSARLLHRSSPNRSTADRRALLLRFQPSRARPRADRPASIRGTAPR